MMMKRLKISKQRKTFVRSRRILNSSAAGLLLVMAGSVQAQSDAPDIPLKEIPVVQSQSQNCTMIRGVERCRQARQRSQRQTRNQGYVPEKQQQLGTDKAASKFANTARFEEAFGRGTRQDDGTQNTHAFASKRKCNVTVLALDASQGARPVNRDFIAGDCQ